MAGTRSTAWAAPAGFAALAAVLAATGAVSPAEALWSAAAVAAALGPSGWLSPGGWRRRAAEAAVVPAAFALTVVGDPTTRLLAVPPLLVLAAAAAAALARRAAPPRAVPVLAAALALAVRAAGGVGLAGVGAAAALAALAVPPVLAWAAARRAGWTAGVAAALLAGALPLQHAPLAAAAAAAVALAAARLAPAPPRLAARIARAWLPGILAAALVLAALAPWGGLGLRRALPRAGWPAAAATGAALLVTPALPAAAAGAAWLAATLATGPIAVPPDHAADTLTAARPRVVLPAASGAPYLVDTSLANAGTLPAGTVVGDLTLGGRTVPLRAGRETVEWAHERADVRPRAGHPLPAAPVWRPVGSGAATVWAVSGRLSVDVPAGESPVLTRAPGLPERVSLTVAAGSRRPTPPRDWPLPAWLLAAAAAVAALQLLSGTWRHPLAWLPWALLAGGALAGRLSVAPAALAAERHSVDIALAALLAAWLPAARVWLARRRAFAAAAALLVPLALAAPHLSPPLGDDAYHLLLLDSIVHDHDLDVTNNYHLDRYPGQAIYRPFDGTFIHSPVLAGLLSPGYALAGRGGAGALVALAGAALFAMALRRARELGVPASRAALAGTALLLSYPLATFSTQLWVEVPGALLALACAVPLTRRRLHPVVASGLAVLATALKTRLALLAVPAAAAAWWRRGGRRRLAVVGGAAVLTAAAAWVLTADLVGTPLDPMGRRHLSQLLHVSGARAATVVGGLAFGAASGLAFAAPLLLVAMLGLPRLWRRAGSGERALLVGAALTVAALLHSVEWRGGDSPPARYLVPAWGLLALAGALLLTRPPRWRPLAVVLLPPGILVWWVGVTRPGALVNVGDGSFWLSRLLARRFSTDALHYFPSFLRISTATWLAPALLVAGAAAVALVARRRPAWARGAAALGTAAWLAAAAALVGVMWVRPDTTVEIEDPQVRHAGGTMEPPPGTFSRFLQPGGWRLEDGASVRVPVHLPPHAAVTLEGWLDGAAVAGAQLAVRWDDGPTTRVAVHGAGRGQVPLPGVPAGGRHWLDIRLVAPAGGGAVLDRLRVGRGR